MRKRSWIKVAENVDLVVRHSTCKQNPGLAGRDYPESPVLYGFQLKTSGGKIHAIGYPNGSSLEEDALDRTHHERCGCAVSAYGRRHEIDQSRSCRGGNDQARISLEPHLRDQDCLAGLRCYLCDPAYFHSWRDFADRLSGRRSRQPTTRRLALVQLRPGTGLFRRADLGRAFPAR